MTKDRIEDGYGLWIGLCYGAFFMMAGLHKNGGERGVWFDRDLQLDTPEHSRIINASNQHYLSLQLCSCRSVDKCML